MNRESSSDGIDESSTPSTSSTSLVNKNIWNETMELKNNLFHIHLSEKYYYCPFCFVDFLISFF